MQVEQEPHPKTPVLRLVYLGLGFLLIKHLDIHTMDLSIHQKTRKGENPYHGRSKKNAKAKSPEKSKT